VFFKDLIQVDGVQLAGGVLVVGGNADVAYIFTGHKISFGILSKKALRVFMESVQEFRLGLLLDAFCGGPCCPARVYLFWTDTGAPRNGLRFREHLYVSGESGPIS
jgi:hypothetical protein